MDPIAISLICILTLAIFAVSVALALVVRHYEDRMGDLMDRLMARDYTDYAAGSRLGKEPLKRWAVSDSRAAQMEKEKQDLERLGLGR